MQQAFERKTNVSTSLIFKDIHDTAMKIGKNATNRLSYKVEKIFCFSIAQQEVMCDKKVV